MSEFFQFLTVLVIVCAKVREHHMSYQAMLYVKVPWKGNVAVLRAENYLNKPGTAQVGAISKAQK